MNDHELILSTAFGLRDEHLELFLVSLHQTAYKGRLTLLVDEKTKLGQQFLSPATTLVAAPRRASSRLARSYKVNQLLQKSGLRPALDALARGAAQRAVRMRRPIPQMALWNLYCGYYLMTSRFFLYYNYLLTHPAKRVLLSDATDVIFQSHPFHGDDEAGLHAYQEDSSVTIGGQPVNASWILEAFGAEALKRMESEPVYCAGTILGDGDSILQMLAQFITTFLSRRINPQGQGIDQGVFNYLISSGLLPVVHRHANGEGVLTMAVMPLGSFHFSDAGVYIDPEQPKPRIVHQYNRFSELTQYLRRQFGQIRA